MQALSRTLRMVTLAGPNSTDSRPGCPARTEATSNVKAFSGCANVMFAAKSNKTAVERMPTATLRLPILFQFYELQVVTGGILPGAIRIS